MIFQLGITCLQILKSSILLDVCAVLQKRTRGSELELTFIENDNGLHFFQIPFSKFYLSAKGRIQDKQEAIQLSHIRCLGITLADAVTGPFQLEIDYIAVVYDSAHPHTFEYEMYPVSPTVFS